MSVGHDRGFGAQVTDSISHRVQKRCQPFPTWHSDLHHVDPDTEGGGTVFSRREGHRHQIVVMRDIVPDGWTDVRDNLLARQPRYEVDPGEGEGGRRSLSAEKSEK
jgi:hypothetical protein